jgi:hypothetical protein
MLYEYPRFVIGPLKSKQAKLKGFSSRDFVQIGDINDFN